MIDYNGIVSRGLAQWRGVIENRLDELSKKPEGLPYPLIHDAMRYSLLDAGKRLRPVLTLEFCRACGEEPEYALDVACAVEMIHTYSLIHDDLPCMDNDELRRGKPSCHAQFDYATALLAGDALQALAAQTIAQSRKGTPEALLRCCAELARLAGAEGMVGGQELDICSEGKEIDSEAQLALVKGKTCALIESACVMGCIIAGASEEKINAARLFANEFGTAFQIIDDILDVIGNAEELGKPIGTDAENAKSTYASIYGVEKAREYAARHTEKALEALNAFGSTEFLGALSLWQLERIS